MSTSRLPGTWGDQDITSSAAVVGPLEPRGRCVETTLLVEGCPEALPTGAR